MTRPEHSVSPEAYYDERESEKYCYNKRVSKIQSTITQRALDLLSDRIKAKNLAVLDLGCGTGISSFVLEKRRNVSIGIDVSFNMLTHCVSTGRILQDIGRPLPFRSGAFDLVVSISTVQWLCVPERGLAPRERLRNLFKSIYTVLTDEGAAVIQYYPENEQDHLLVTRQALKAGFVGGTQIDNCDSSKKKYYIVLLKG